MGRELGKKLLLLPCWRPHQVIQRGLELPIEGLTKPNSCVRLLFVRMPAEGRGAPATEPKCLFSCQVTTDSRGWFSATLPPQEAAAGVKYALVAHVTKPDAPAEGYSRLIRRDGDDTVVLRDLLVGDVWAVLGTAATGVTLEERYSERELDRFASNDDFRFMHVPANPERQLKWRPFSGETKGRYPQVGYHFLVSLYKEMEIPLGLVELVSDDTLGPGLEDIERGGGFYRSYLQRVEGLGLCGLIWQMGGKDLRNLEYVSKALPGVLQRIDHLFLRRTDIPLLTILSHLRSTPEVLRRADEAQHTLAYFNMVLDDVAMRANRFITTAPVYDLDPRYAEEDGLGNPDKPLHRKQEGRRWATLALDLIHEQRSTAMAVRHMQDNSVSQSPPAYPRNRCPKILSTKVVGSNLMLEFGEFAGSLIALQEPLQGFVIAGETGPLRPARAQLITHSTICLSHPDIARPAHCGYACTIWNMDAGLRSPEGLPALPFATCPLKGQPSAQPWMSFLGMETWGMRRMEEDSVQSLPSLLPNLVFPPGVEGELSWSTTLSSLLPDARSRLARERLLCVSYHLLSQTEREVRLRTSPNEDYIGLFSPAGPYAWPRLPDWSPYHVLTIWTYNPDERPKQLRLRASEPRMISARKNWQLHSFALPAGTEQGFPLFSVRDTGDNSNPRDGKLYFGMVELWTDATAALQYVTKWREYYREV